MKIPSIRTFALLLSAGALLLASCAGPGDKPGNRNAEIPLHWEICFIDSVGGIPADQFVYMPSDRVRPGPPVGSVPGGDFVATIDTAIARGVLFRQTAFLIATRYSRSQQIEFGDLVAKALRRPLVLDSLRTRRDEMLSLLGGMREIEDRKGRTVRMHVLSTADMRRLSTLPVSAYFEIEDVALGEAAGQVGQRMLCRDLVDLLRLRLGDGQLAPPESALALAALSDTTMPFSSRIEFSRHWILSMSRSIEGLPEPISGDSVARRTTMLLRPALEAWRARKPTASRYHDLDDLDSPGNLAR